VPSTVATTAAITKGTLAWIKPELLRPNGWNPNQMDAFMFDKELESLRRFGMASPVVVRDSNGFEIIDGEHRWKAWMQLGQDSIPVWNVGPIPDIVAKQLSIVLNETRGSAEKQKLADLLQDLLKSETTESLIDVLPYSKEAFAELVNLPAFDWEEFEKQTPRQVDSWVERIYRLPIEAAKVLDQAIERAKDGESIPDGVALERIAADYLAD
jgi:ParB-like chromosome segregation protein Spo0J